MVKNNIGNIFNCVARPCRVLGDTSGGQLINMLVGWRARLRMPLRAKFGQRRVYGQSCGWIASRQDTTRHDKTPELIHPRPPVSLCRTKKCLLSTVGPNVFFFRSCRAHLCSCAEPWKEHTAMSQRVGIKCTDDLDLET